MLLNGVFYIVIPHLLAAANGLRAADLFRSLEWRRNAWIIAAYWALDFFGPIISGVNFFSLSGNNMQWAFQPASRPIPSAQGYRSCY